MRISRQQSCILFQEIQIFADILPMTIQKCRALKPLLQILTQRKIKYWWAFPFTLKFAYKGKTHSFSTFPEGESSPKIHYTGPSKWTHQICKQDSPNAPHLQAQSLKHGNLPKADGWKNTCQLEDVRKPFFFSYFTFRGSTLLDFLTQVFLPVRRNQTAYCLNFSPNLFIWFHFHLVLYDDLYSGTPTWKHIQNPASLFSNLCLFTYVRVVLSAFDSSNSKWIDPTQPPLFRGDVGLFAYLSHDSPIFNISSFPTLPAPYTPSPLPPSLCNLLLPFPFPHWFPTGL